MLSRRSLLAGGAAALAASPLPASGQAQTTAPTSAEGPARTILRVERRSIEVNGKSASVYAIRQPDGTFGLTTEAGKPFRVRVENGIDRPTLIHWHGMTPPWRQDGVPGISGPPIPAGGSADYDFPLNFGGTFWMHSHEGLQEQFLMTAPLIIHDERDRADEQELVVMLADFSVTPPEEIYADLRKSGSTAGMGKDKGGGKMMMMSSMNSAKAEAPDLNDVKYDAFLANFRTLADPETVKVEPRGRLLLRIVNSSSMSNFHIDLGEREGELVAVDGFAVEPIRASRFPVAVAQRLDIRLELPRGPGVYPVLAQVEGERNHACRGRGDRPSLPGRNRGGFAGAEPRSRADFARHEAPRASQARPRPHPEPHRRDGRLCLVDQQCGVEPGRAAAAGFRGRAGRARVRQSDADAPSNASARA
jgi:FtsP/CotA-like multicopper oxidase with cupredoxin domain